MTEKGLSEHIILGVLALTGGAYFWYSRISAAKDAAATLADAAIDVRLAARRFGFRRKANIHPAEAVDDARLAAMGLIAAPAQMDHGWSRETGDSMTAEAQAVFKISRQEAEEMVIFGRWLSDQRGTKSCVGW